MVCEGKRLGHVQTGFGELGFRKPQLPESAGLTGSPRVPDRGTDEPGPGRPALPALSSRSLSAGAAGPGLAVLFVGPSIVLELGTPEGGATGGGQESSSLAKGNPQGESEQLVRITVLGSGMTAHSSPRPGEAGARCAVPGTVSS